MKLKNRVLGIAICLLTSLSLSAQFTVSGTIMDEFNEPVIGATIQVVGTTIGEATDIDGKFSINVPGNTAQLEISYVGFATQTIDVTAANPVVNITLVQSADLLDEVVITTGYGNQLRSTFTGAASSANVEDMAEAPRTNFVESLDGAVAGLQVNQGSGQPGAFQNVRIRGLGSINAGTNPLYVIDGIPVINENIGNESTTSTPLAGLNPSDIADLQVLKDASATSIYGSRGANGVIIITTKKGATGKPKISLDLQSGFSDVSLADDIKPLNTAEYLELQVEGVINRGLATNEADAITYLQGRGIDPSVDSDWFEAITRRGNFNNANLSISGGNDNTTYFFSGGFQESEGTVIGTDFTRATTRLNLSTKVTDWMRVNVNTSGSFTKQNTVPSGGAFANPVRSIFRFIPTQPIYNEDGSYNTVINAGFHPIGNVIENKDQSNILNLLGSINAVVDLNFLPGLTYEPFVSINRIEGTDETFFIPDFGTGNSDNGFAEADFDNNTNWLVRNMLKYSNYINDTHGIDVTLGHEAQKFSSYFVQTSQRNFAFPSLITLSNGSEPEFISGDKTENTIESYFLNTSYNYKGIYYVNATVRRDGSSRFGSGNRQGTFWSGGVAANLDRMDFMAGNKTFSQLRIRASYGENGNESIGNFASRGLYSTGTDYLDNPGIFLSQLENSNLTWEVNKQFDIGIEVGLWDRINIIADIYNRKTSDLLFSLPVSLTNGVSSVTSNIGELQNAGVELELETRNFVSNNNGFEWDTRFNITFNKNEVLSLPEGDFADGSRFRAVGQPWSTWYMRGYAGVDTQTGEPLWYTDGTESETTTVYNNADPYQQGTSDPDFFGGMVNTFRYKGFELSAQLNFVSGGQLLHAWHRFTHTDGQRGSSTTGNLARSIYDRRWQQPGDVTDTPQFIFGRNRGSQNRSTRFLYDADYISLRDVTLRYSLPASLTDKIGMSAASVFLRGSNLWISVKDDRLERDPRADAGGVIDQEIPIPQTFTFGLNANF